MSATNPFTNNCYRCINKAGRDAGYLGVGREFGSDELAEYMGMLNDIANFEQTQGIKLWLQEDFSLQSPQLQTGVGTYTLGPAGTVPMVKPTRCIESYFVEQLSQNRRPVGIISRNEWDTLSTINQQGTITSIWPDKQQLTLNINVWQTPSAIETLGQLHLILQTQINQVTALTDTMSFPIEWFLFLEWSLADEMATGQPMAVQAKCKANRATYTFALEAWDVEDAATRFTPDTVQMSSAQRQRFNK
jgi:hypothetical protein